MDPTDKCLTSALVKGYERMAAWSNLLDEINVYPVPDADTGRNLRISLAPIKFAQPKDLTRQLLLAATGNSGNIAGAFFAEFSRANTPADILDAAIAGKDAAWTALHEPRPGTMLTVFDSLTNVLRHRDLRRIISDPDHVIEQLKISVLSTATLLEELRQADVVDAGALAMFLFFEGFFNGLNRHPNPPSNPYDLFGGKIRLSRPVNGPHEEGYCIDTVIRPADMGKAVQALSAMGKNVVTVSDDQHLKVHLHAPDDLATQKNIAAVGDMVRWKSEKIEAAPPSSPTRENSNGVHIVTDAAGSLERKKARDLGITLLDSYIILEDRHLPESMVSPHQLYDAMSRGIKVTTAQASAYERQQHYHYLTDRFDHSLYLCVGSAYTGNYEIADQWVRQHPEHRQMAVIDTGAASGRLGLITRKVALYADGNKDPARVMQFAQTACGQCDELVFLDQLKFLAAGGRISKSSGFFGDLLKIKPIIRPGATGAQKVGVVKKHEQQVDFLVNHLDSRLSSKLPSEILLQYTDNEDRVVSGIQPVVQKLLPLAKISVGPMSLTSGVHMGPGTWAAAFYQE